MAIYVSVFFLNWPLLKKTALLETRRQLVFFIFETASADAAAVAVVAAVVVAVAVAVVAAVALAVAVIVAVSVVASVAVVVVDSDILILNLCFLTSRVNMLRV